ncbi:similar to Saccharomyces cerevisiae YMR149W SWP1 Delta subunit of the oligosaccharyl transferase glycoprotein complex [Maudiozyma barnettii]|uniref:Similar to Saccharomyces cerevisiae YMR149W SWP1 Delta subunit of the oligosaccharyl transferase glycoprotein complex n=1 Tax=Maudiozyma barnettii TaxID=61262 RepID=A0A8H2ZH80_9SACH|nr:dolichyl-diphosphooligosaccharide-protein glycotransferase [Kazachstania barnettii]CAB4254483.1 similar to Saccharomyces cerevisiae YMR149W SWP1 Delta subunit of the oligosaccharyl transferase glycoprotein complex [Kazachstania barnettii]CAD1782477.1 similar to Saccharomyces cerevisiae YMR149W SWP1 Delta subunit of the oligosaccharyl transferase glycoprotein complex [Kazachstania barnettii]
MKLLKAITVLTTAIGCASAFIIKDAKISFKDETREAIELGQLDETFMKAESAPLLIKDLDEVVSFKFKLDLSKSKSKEIPQQLSLLVGIADKALEVPIVAKVKDSSKNNKVKLVSFKVDLQALPKSVLHYAFVNDNEQITASLIVANDKKQLARKETNLYFPVFHLQFTDSAKETIVDTFEEPLRYGKQVELAHTFPNPPKTADPTLSLLFAGAVTMVNMFLYMYWINFNAISFENFPSGKDFIPFIGFFGSIIGCEIVFALYYLGTGIFETVNCLAIVAPVGLILGSKFLRSYNQKI